MTWIDDVLHFWFSELGADGWWAGTPEIDDTIRARFGGLYRELKASPPQASSLDGRGHLAAVIVFDQFSRNLFRNSADAFAADPLALALARDAVDRGLDKALDDEQRQFLYMPFMHSEDPAMQARSVALFSSIGVQQALESARAHKGWIDRFGRFPFRNRALGRVSTPAEERFLKSEGYPGNMPAPGELH